MPRFYSIVCLLFLSMIISSCSISKKIPEKVYGPTLADLETEVAEEEPMPVPVATADQIEDSYRSALEVARDPDIRHKILVRLADLEMAQSEDAQIDAEEQKLFFDDAISMYEELIGLNKERQEETGTPTNERLLYQLSKAYALDGRIEESNEILSQLVNEFPSSAFAAEAEFRRADLAFSERRYQDAETLYTQVIQAGDDTPFYLNAVYMKGWSTFKRSRYRASIASFTEVLDRSLPEGKTLDDLSKGQKNLIADTLRVMSLVFSYLDGADTISEVYLKLGERHYKHLLYASLGQLYFEKDRYRDSADTYLHFVRRFPNNDHSPSFNVKAIEVYEKGGFPSLVLPAKEEYVSNYGVRSEFWRSRKEDQRQSLMPNLKLYLVELSSYYHADAQGLDQALLDYNKARAEGKKPKAKPGPSQPQYLKAAALYGEFALTFASDSKTPEMVFLQGEAYYSGKHYPEAVESFETVAFQYIDQKFGPDAGYNAIIVAGEIVDSLQDKTNPTALEQLEAWKIRKINNSISYSNYYSTDERAAPVLTKATQEIFENGEFQRAIELALRLTSWQPPQSPELKTTAWFVLAHSYFDLDQFADAESAYRTILGRLSAQDTRRKDVVDRIAASIYRQSEFLVAAGDKVGAIDRLLQIREISGGSEIAITAQYDAINYLLELKQWTQAESELDNFKASFPDHKFAQTLAPKYVLVYQETEQWSKAASVLSVMSQSGDPDERRTSLYLAAELYERSGNANKAIAHYREYAHTYPEPFGIATEARFHLVELYEQIKEPQKKDFWLRKLIEADAAAGAARTVRSRSLAAMASAKFADEQFKKFRRIKLTLPIKKSMKGKKKAMDRTLDQYKALMDYGIADYVTEANHRIAEVYASLSRDLMDSQRPKGLDELALEQYEILLEEQAYPFEEKAIDIYKSNTDRSKQGIYDKWVKESFDSLAKILPARYAKKEKAVELSDDIF